MTPLHHCTALHCTARHGTDLLDGVAAEVGAPEELEAVLLLLAHVGQRDPVLGRDARPVRAQAHASVQQAFVLHSSIDGGSRSPPPVVVRNLLTPAHSHAPHPFGVQNLLPRRLVHHNAARAPAAAATAATARRDGGGVPPRDGAWAPSRGEYGAGRGEARMRVVEEVQAVGALPLHVCFFLARLVPCLPACLNGWTDSVLEVSGKERGVRQEGAFPWLMWCGVFPINHHPRPRSLARHLFDRRVPPATDALVLRVTRANR